jgi:hypothetical protein
VVRLTGLAPLLGHVAAVAVEPAPNGPQPVLPWWVDANATVAMVVLLASGLASAAGGPDCGWPPSRVPA